MMMTTSSDTPPPPPEPRDLDNKNNEGTAASALSATAPVSKQVAEETQTQSPSLSSSLSFSALPPHTFGIMIHKNYQARLLDAWQPASVDLIQVVDNKGPKSSLARRGYHVLVCHGIRTGGGGSGNGSGSSNMQQQEQQQQQQQQQQERMLLSLAPMARQNISWMARLQHKLKVVQVSSNNNDSSSKTTNKGLEYEDPNHGAALSKVMASVWQTIIGPPEQKNNNNNIVTASSSSSSTSFDLQNDMVRVDVFPRTWLEPVCTALQQEVHAWRHNYNPTLAPPLPLADLPFDGPLRMTASRSQCTVRLTIVLQQNSSSDNDNNDNHHPSANNHQNTTSTNMDDASPSNATATTATTVTTTTCYWGMDRRPTDDSLMDIPLNHEAHQEMVIVPMAPKDGTEIVKEESAAAEQQLNNSSVIAPTTPLSRAYYKLWQVWHDEMLQNYPTVAAALQGGTGLDVGASPGGWTQVLLYAFQCASVICLDPAVVAQRVLQHPGVFHAACHLEKWQTHATEHTQTPLSTLVCDASVLWDDLLQQLSKHILPFTQWKLPAVLVLTCKLPSRTAKSIVRQVQGIRNRVSGFLDTWKPYFTAAAAAQKEEKNDGKNSISEDVHGNDVTMEWKLLHLFANSESERTLLIVIKSSTAASAAAGGASASAANDTDAKRRRVEP